MKGFRSSDAEETLKKAIKLEPIKKSGKERHQMMDEMDDDIEMDYRKRESVLDYFDDGQ